MKVKNVFVLLILFLGLMCFNCIEIEARSNETEDLDNYGIINGKVIDEDNGKPVSEIFFVSISDPNYILLSRFGIETDNNGYFKGEWETGTYLLYFFPRSNTSRYCWDKNPKKFPGERYIIKVEKGKITEIVKKAKLAGQLRLTLESNEGDKINLQNIFGKRADCSVRIEGESLIDSIEGSQFTNNDDFNDGEMLVHCLCPDIYTIDLSFDGMGIGSVLLKDIVIKKNSITDVKVKIDLNDRTGVQGAIYYEGGEFIENVRVSLGGPQGSSESITASVYTDQKGYYKIVGLKEGRYYMSFKKKLRDLLYLRIPPKEVIVRNGSLSRLDIKMKNLK